MTKLASEGGYGEPEVIAILAFLCRHGVEREPSFRWRPFLPDPGDEFVLDLASAAPADFIITFNRRDFTGAEKFGIGIVTPGEFLRILEEAPEGGKR